MPDIKSHKRSKWLFQILLSLLLSVSVLGVRSEGDIETWLGHIGDWAIFYISQSGRESRCVGKRDSGGFQYHLSLGENSDFWSLWIYSSVDLTNLPLKRYRITLNLDDNEKYSLDASATENNGLVVSDLPVRVIESLRYAGHLSVKVEDRHIGEFSLLRAGNLIDALVACHQEQIHGLGEEAASVDTIGIERISDLNRRANELRGNGQFEHGIEVAQMALAQEEKAFGVGHLLTADTIEDLAILHMFTGRYAEAESLYMKALEIKEQALGIEHPSLADSLIGLAVLFTYQGRYAEAEPLHRKALALAEQSLGAEHAVLATGFNNLAGLYRDQGRLAEAESMYKKALQLRERDLGPEHPRVAATRQGLALVYSDQGRYAQAEELYRKTISIQELALGVEHPDLAISGNNLGYILFRQGRYAEAEALYRKSIALIERSLGPVHPNLAISLSNLAFLYRNQGNVDEEQRIHQRVQRIDTERLRQGLPGKQGGVATAQRNHALDYLYLLARHKSAAPEASADTLMSAQLARRGQHGDALRLLAQRLAAGGSGELAALVRERQDLIQQIDKLENQLIDIYGKPEDKLPKSVIKSLRARIEALQLQERKLRERLGRDYPNYVEFEGSSLTDIASLQRVLQPAEAAVAWVLSKEKGSYLLIVPHEGNLKLKAISITETGVAKRVEQLHQALDLGDPSHDGELAAFPAAVAAELFDQLFGADWETDLKGIDQLVLVPEGPLTRLAFPALLTETPEHPEFPPSSQRYREAPWLARRFAVSVLPSLSSLTLLRGDIPENQSAEPFLGVGDPLLDDHPTKTRRLQQPDGGQLVGVRNVRNTAQVQPEPASAAEMRGTRLQRIRQQPSLPDTAEELQRIAKLLGASEDALLLREAATEQRVKETALNQYATLSFATHGVLAGELGKGIEPGLILTPPDEATDADDGFLSLSDIAALDLNADWVLLSACNTAGSSDESSSGRADGRIEAGEGLTGLAKAFTYAGAKALLVSQWSVASGATVDLMEKLFRGYRDQQLSRAEAHRQAMLGMLDAEDPLYSHPSIWAPFVVVGDGG